MIDKSRYREGLACRGMADGALVIVIEGTRGDTLRGPLHPPGDGCLRRDDRHPRLGQGGHKLYAAGVDAEMGSAAQLHGLPAGAVSAFATEELEIVEGNL